MIREDDIRAAVRRYKESSGAVSLPLKAALIDMDGVLYDSMKYHTLAWQRMMSEIGVECSRDEFYLYEGMTGAATIELLMKRSFGKSVTAEESAALYRKKTEYFKSYGERETMPGAADMLAAFRDFDVDRVLVTGSGQQSLIGTLSHDYPGMFADDKRVTASDVVHGKPAPEPYLRGLEKAGVLCSEAIVVENAPLGVKSGHDAGCFVCAVTTGPIPESEMLRAGADIVFSSMPEFAASVTDLVRIMREA